MTASAGVAPNKFLAKLASEMNKPDGVTVVPRGPLEIEAFLAPLPVGRIWGVGPVLEAKLRARGIQTIGDLQQVAVDTLDQVAGKHTADHLRKLARGIDARPISVDVGEKSISREHTYAKDVRDIAVITRTLHQLVAHVGHRLRVAGLYAGTARIKIRWQGFRTITRQCALDPPCCDDFSLRAAATRLLQAEVLRHPVRLIGFGVQDMRPRSTQQLDLFDGMGQNQERRERLSRAMDQVRERFGTESIDVATDVKDETL